MCINIGNHQAVEAPMQEGVFFSVAFFQEAACSADLFSYLFFEGSHTCNELGRDTSMSMLDSVGMLDGLQEKRVQAGLQTRGNTAGNQSIEQRDKAREPDETGRTAQTIPSSSGQGLGSKAFSTVSALREQVCSHFKLES